MKDRIHLLGASLQCQIGVTAQERAQPQELIGDVTVDFDIRPAARTDDVALTVDYERIFDLLQELCAAREYALVETLVEAMAKAILERFSVERVHILLKKPGALRHRGVAAAAVEIDRER